LNPKNASIVVSPLPYGRVIEVAPARPVIPSFTKLDLAELAQHDARLEEDDCDVR
jgi:hypothetical protein